MARIKQCITKPENLPTLQEVNQLLDQAIPIYQEFGWPSTDTLWRIWNNSTKTKGIRVVRIDFPYAAPQETINTINEKMQEVLKTLPANCWEYRTYNMRQYVWENQGPPEMPYWVPTKILEKSQFVRKTRNVLKIYYKARKYTK